MGGWLKSLWIVCFQAVLLLPEKWSNKGIHFVILWKWIWLSDSFFFSFFLSQISIFYFELSLSGWTCGLWHWRHVPEEMYLALGSAALPSCVMIQGEIIWQGSRSIALASWSVFSAQPIDSSTRTGPQQGQRNIKKYLKMMVIFWSPNLFHGLLHAHYLHRIFDQKRISWCTTI